MEKTKGGLTMKKIFNEQMLKKLNIAALFMAVLTANSTCMWVAYQPEFPEEANKLKINAKK